MRVLWFTYTPSLSADYLKNKSVGGGWIGSLEAELSKIQTVQLGISFNLDRDIKPFTINQTKYFPVYNAPPKGKINKLVSRWKKRIKDEADIQPYLDIIDEFKPDIVHIFGTEGIFGLIISKVTIPCIIHIQGVLTICVKKWYSGLTVVDILKYSEKWRFLKGFGNYHDYLVNKKLAQRERRIFKKCKYFMGRTDWDRRVISVLSPNSTYFHCDEIIRPEFYSHDFVDEKSKPDFVILTTIRSPIYKGLEAVFECKRILNEMNFGSKVIWKIAGISETDEISNIVERKYRSTFGENGIQLLGPLQENDLINEMLLADVFIHPSHIDNSPNSVCEAMLLGIPVIATFAGGIPSIIENNIEGLLVQDGDPYAMAGAIIEIKENYDRAISLGSHARKKALARHDKNKIVNDLVNIYQRVLELENKE
jgi:glycosyltransferase involved in cell wall biosynthesis